MEVKRCKKCLKKLLSKDEELTKEDFKTAPNVIEKEDIQPQIPECKQTSKHYANKELLRESCCKKRKCPTNVQFSDSFRALLASQKRCCEKSDCVLAKQFCDIHEPTFNKCVNDLPGSARYHYLSIDAFTSTVSESEFMKMEEEVDEVDFELNEFEENKDGDNTEEPPPEKEESSEQEKSVNEPEDSEDTKETLEPQGATRVSILKSTSEDGTRPTRQSIVVVMDKPTKAEMISYITLIEDESSIVSKAPSDKSKKSNVDGESTVTVEYREQRETINDDDTYLSMGSTGNNRIIDLEKINEEFEQRNRKGSAGSQESEDPYDQGRKRLSIVSWHINESDDDLKEKTHSLRPRTKSAKELADEAALDEKRSSLKKRSILNEVVDLANEQMRVSMIRYSTETEKSNDSDSNTTEGPVSNKSEESSLFHQRSRLKSSVDTAALLSKLDHSNFKKKFSINSDSTTNKGWFGKMFKGKSPKEKSDSIVSENASDKMKTIEPVGSSYFEIQKSSVKM